MNRIKFAFWLGLLLILSSCKKKLEVVKESGENEKLSIEYQRRTSDFAKHGWHKMYYPDGSLFEESNYVENELDGIRKLYHENGNIQAEETYSKGLFEGPFKAYFPDGKLSREGQYKANTMDGDWKYYYETGQLKEIVRFKDNLENGPFEEYYPNGKKKAEGTYKGGDFEHGELRLYDSTGTLEKIMDCDMGVCRTREKVDS